RAVDNGALFILRRTSIEKELVSVNSRMNWGSWNVKSSARFCPSKCTVGPGKLTIRLPATTSLGPNSTDMASADAVIKRENPTTATAFPFIPLLDRMWAEHLRGQEHFVRNSRCWGLRSISGRRVG